MSVTGVIAIILTSSVVGLVYLLAYIGKADSDIFKVLVGGLMTVGFANVVGYYFGSSASSKAKDETISSMVANGGPGSGSAAVTAAAVAAAPAAAKEAAPPAAEAAAPPVVEAIVPPAVEAAVTKAFAHQAEEHKS